MNNYEENLNNSKKLADGVGCTDLLETLPAFNKAECETLYKGKNNTDIVLGRDRPSGTFSGYGGAGEDKCGAIDIVAGRVSCIDMNDLRKRNLKVNNDFFLDAARIYISQKTNIDDNLKLTNGKVGNSKGKSGIFLKADDLRFVARNGIKLVTGTDKYDSNGKKIVTSSGIDLIANNDDSNLQPIVLGKNLKECVDVIFKDVRKIYSEITSIYEILTTLITTLSLHTHITGAPGSPTSPSVELSVVASSSSALIGLHLIDTVTAATKNAANSIKYLEEFSEKYINSRFNNSN